MKTYKKVVFETADELLDAFERRKASQHLEHVPTLPDTAYIVFSSDDSVSLSGVGGDPFDVAGAVTQHQVVSKLMKRADIKFHWT